MQGTVAVYLESESCDSYLHLFEQKTVTEIGEFLRSQMEMFEPLSDYTVTSHDKDFESEVYELMKEISTESWGR